MISATRWRKFTKPLVLTRSRSFPFDPTLQLISCAILLSHACYKIEVSCPVDLSHLWLVVQKSLERAFRYYCRVVHSDTLSVLRVDGPSEC
jgi:hypothetical protein